MNRSPKLVRRAVSQSAFCQSGTAISFSTTEWSESGKVNIPSFPASHLMWENETASAVFKPVRTSSTHTLSFVRLCFDLECENGACKYPQEMQCKMLFP